MFSSLLWETFTAVLLPLHFAADAHSADPKLLLLGSLSTLLSHCDLQKLLLLSLQNIPSSAGHLQSPSTCQGRLKLLKTSEKSCMVEFKAL